MAVVAEINLEELTPWLTTFARSLNRIDWDTVLENIAILLESSTQENFERGAGPDGKEWAPLKRPRNRPRDRSAAIGSQNQQRPLRDTGLLMASLTATHPNHIREINNGILKWGTNVEYAGIHQFGGKIKKPERRRGKGEKPWVFTGQDGSTVFTKKIRAHEINIPARPFIGTNDQLLEDISDLLAEEVIRQLGGPGA